MDYKKLEEEVVAFINAIRLEPKSIIAELEDMKKCFKDKYFKIPNTNINVITNEGVKAVNEAIEFLKSQESLPALKEMKGLYDAAKDHCIDIGKHGLASHEGTDGTRMCDRIEKYGEWQMSIAENICFDDNKARDIVLGQIIDDGNKTRGHRNNIFSEDFKSIGVACGPHIQYKHCCVINFAINYKDRELKKEVVEDNQNEIYRRKTTVPDERMGVYKKSVAPIPVDISFKQSINQQQPTEETNQLFKQSVSTHKESQAPPKESFSKNIITKESKAEKINIDGNDEPRESILEMPVDAVSCKVKKFVKTKGNKRTIKVIKTYTMKDGSTETVEEVDEEYI